MCVRDSNGLWVPESWVSGFGGAVEKWSLRQVEQGIFLHILQKK